MFFFYHSYNTNIFINLIFNYFYNKQLFSFIVFSLYSANNIKKLYTASSINKKKNNLYKNENIKTQNQYTNRKHKNTNKKKTICMINEILSNKNNNNFEYTN